ncbi:MAG: SDR family oxidoreductase [archaeon]
MAYIITGGAGFIGSHLAEKLSQDSKVIVIDDLSTGKEENLSAFRDRISFVKCDITEPGEMEKVVSSGDIIYHEAALASVSRSIDDPFSSNKVNVEGTLSVLLAARNKKAKRVIFASSSSVYGDSEKLPKIEDMPYNPKSPYAATKMTAEIYMQLFWKIYGVETVCLRYFNVFGPRQDPNSEYSAVIPKFIKLMKQGKRPIIYGDGSQTRDFTYIENVVAANLLAEKSDAAKGEIINIACSDRISLLELVREINVQLKTDIKPIFKPARIGDVKHSQAGIEKAKKILGYAQKISFSVGLNKTISGIK